MNDDGTFSEAAQLFIGEDRFAVRKKIVPQLESEGFLVKIEDYPNQVGYSERSDAVVEPRLSMQWWVKMAPLAEKALAVVEDGEINFHPAKFKNLYRHWMEGIKDWCISRQLWWGQRIPAWYLPDGTFFVAATREEAWEKYSSEKANVKSEKGDGFTSHVSLRQAQDNAPFTINDLHQDDDCLDTWFSSWLWPFEVFKGYSHTGNEDVKYYYPTATLVTAPEIIFFWVARMIMAGLEYQKEIPFKDVYFTGIVRDKQGRKMSKSLGNSPDLLELIDQYGADSVRFGILIASPAGNDILFDESALEQGRNFTNKLWNALKLIKIWQEKGAAANNGQPNFANTWFGARLNEVKSELNDMLSQFRLSEALKTLYSLIWDDYCSWYLEWIKPPYGSLIEEADLQQAIIFYEELMLMLHPFMPFITEEIYHQLAIRAEGDDICIKTVEAVVASVDTSAIAQGELLKKVITALRDARNKNQIKPKENIELTIETANEGNYTAVQKILSQQANATILFANGPIPGAIAIAMEKDKYFIKTEQAIDTTSQKETLLKDLEYQRTFLASVEKKLSNEKFVANAKPEVVAFEEKKKADALARIQNIEESLASL
jgi:valyl-tRNA synthetase